MSMNSHIMAVTISEFSFDADYWIKSPGLAWCGESFETGYVFREQIDIVLGPLMSAELLSIVNGQTVAFTDPTLEQLRENESGARVTALTPMLYAELRAVVQAALTSGDWGYHDNYDWQALVDDEDTTGDYYVIIEFE